MWLNRLKHRQISYIDGFLAYRADRLVGGFLAWYRAGRSIGGFLAYRIGQSVGGTPGWYGGGQLVDGFLTYSADRLIDRFLT